MTIELSETTLAEIVESIWTTMLGLSMTPDIDPQLVRCTRGLAVSVHIVGGWNGTVLYLPSEQFARCAASLMLDVPASEVSADDMHDSAAELCNIIAGSVKSILPGPSSLSLPTVALGGDYEVRVRHARTLSRLAFRSQGETQQVLVLEADKQ